MTSQLPLDLETIHVVGNCWGPVWHVNDSHSRTFMHPNTPGMFDTVLDAVAFAVSHGRNPIVHEHWCFETNRSGRPCQCHHSSLGQESARLSPIKRPTNQ